MIKLIKTLSLFFFLVSNVSAQTQFVKYKNYLIPIVQPATVCTPLTPSSTPKVFYMNDIGYYPEDPDGVFDLPIVMGWAKAGKIDLLGVGASTPNHSSSVGNHHSLVESIMNESVALADRVPVTKGSAIVQKIKDLASAEDCLHIVIGGPWEYLADAITSFTDGSALQNEFLSKISVVGIGGSNIAAAAFADEPVTCGSSGSTSLGCDYYTVKNKLNPLGKMLRLDKDDYVQSYPHPNSNDLKFSVLDTSAKRIEVDQWFEDEFLLTTKVGNYINNQSGSKDFLDRTDKGGVRWLLCRNTSTCPVGDSLGRGGKDGKVPGKGMNMRIADFNAVAVLIWGYSASVLDYSSSMKFKLIEAWNELLP